MTIDHAAIEARNEERRKLRDAATPGPWYVVHHDDQLFMCATSIRTDRDDTDFCNDAPYDGCVAMTLLQSPRYICHEDEKWDGNAALIAYARTDPAVEDIAALLAERAALLAEVRRLTDDAAEKNAVIRSMSERIEELQRRLNETTTPANA